MSLDSWYHVSFDEEYIYRNVETPGKERWNDKFRWDEIIRVCYQPGDFLETDVLYIFTSEREESYLIPIEADGAPELWRKLIEKNLFDAKLAIEIVSMSDGLYCWPED
jgi:hypothetical protein